MTGFDPDKHHRRSIRIPGYDYSSMGAYFVTVCAHDRRCLFGEVGNGAMRLNGLGEIVADEWAKTAEMRRRIRVDAFVVMPNHLHGILVINDCRGTLQRAPTTEQFGRPTSDSIPTIVRLFKSATTKRINQMRHTPGVPVWQRNYFEHIVRDEDECGHVREYIEMNPVHWAEDMENPNGTPKKQ